ncbi:hypothetical protein Tco_1171124 [Tanacetum coccineum]
MAAVETNDREVHRAMNNGTRTLEQVAYHLGIDVDVFRKRLWKLQQGSYHISYPSISTLLEQTVLGCHRDWTTVCSHHRAHAANPTYQGGPMRLDVKSIPVRLTPAQAMEVADLFPEEEVREHNPNSEKGTDEDDMDYDTSSEEVTDEYNHVQAPAESSESDEF